jgi:hypothetical protein
MKKPRHATAFRIVPLILPILFTFSPEARAAIIFSEDFETDGEGTRYRSHSAFSDGDGDYFIRTDGLTGPSGVPAYEGFGGSFFWAAEDVDANDNPTGFGILDFSGISLSGTTSFEISLDIAAGSTAAFDSVDDFLFVQYRFDGGPWETALAFQNDGERFNSALLRDTDFDGIGDSDPLGLDFQTARSGFLASTGNLLDLRIDTFMTSGGEAVAFDNLNVTAVAVPEPALGGLLTAAGAGLLLLRRKFLPQKENESRA